VTFEMHPSHVSDLTLGASLLHVSVVVIGI
jgi:hypothetical protein